MARIALGGVPLHPLLNDLPAALLSSSALCDVMATVTGRDSWAQCAYRSLQFGVVSGFVAAAIGLMDYKDVPSQDEAQQAGRRHMLLNVGALALSALNLMRRSADSPRSGAFGTALSLVTLGGLAYSATQGALLAYKYRMAAPSRGLSEVLS